VAVRSAWQARVVRVAVVGLGIFLLAAAIRLYAIDAYVTIDESRWVQRAADFAAYVGRGKPEETFIIGHPGVTTMWTALLGMGPERAHRFSFLEGRDDATRREGYFDALSAARRPFAVVAALGVAAVALLGWRLLGAGAAVVGGLLLAFEPFLVAHARVAHLDSGLTTYMAVAALSALVYCAAGGSWPYLVLSGVATGLAFLTKAPSIYLFAFVPLAAGLCWLASDRRPAALPRLAALLVVWVLIAALVGAVLWPSFRVDPIGTLLQMAQFTERVGGGEHDNFFLGSVTDDPGPSFYPFALLIRLAPVTLAGLVLVAWTWRRWSAGQPGVVALLVLYCLGFMAMMTIGPKKFDRYLLPLYPMLGLLAGLGLWSVATRLGGGLGAASRPSPMALAVLGAAVVLQAATLLPVVRYPLAYYSPLLGGGAFAEDLILVGWGEGLDQVAAWIDAQPRPLGEPTVATSYHRVLQAQLTGSAVPLEHVRMADYVVPYVNTLQRGDAAQVLGPYLGSSTPEHTVTINGIEYARVYRGPHYPVSTEQWIGFGDRVTLIRDVMAPGSADLRAGEELTISLRWDRAPAAQERVIVAILGPDGRPVVQDERKIGEDGPDQRGQPGDLHRLTVPARTAPGTYRLVLRVVDGRTRATVPASGGSAADGDWLVVRDLAVTRSP
jgi:hypothetical protein